MLQKTSRVTRNSWVEWSWPSCWTRDGLKCHLPNSYILAIRQAANLNEVNIDPIVGDLVQRDAHVTEWRAKQTDTVNEEASSKKLGSLFVLDYEIEEDQAYLEDVQSSHEALHLARLADAEDGEVDIDFGTRYIEGAVEDES